MGDERRIKAGSRGRSKQRKRGGRARRVERGEDSVPSPPMHTAPYRLNISCALGEERFAPTPASTFIITERIGNKQYVIMYIRVHTNPFKGSGVSVLVPFLPPIPRPIPAPRRTQAVYRYPPTFCPRPLELTTPLTPRGSQSLLLFQMRPREPISDPPSPPMTLPMYPPITPPTSPTPPTPPPIDDEEEDEAEE